MTCWREVLWAHMLYTGRRTPRAPRRPSLGSRRCGLCSKHCARRPLATQRRRASCAECGLRLRWHRGLDAEVIGERAPAFDAKRPTPASLPLHSAPRAVRPRVFPLVLGLAPRPLSSPSPLSRLPSPLPAPCCASRAVQRRCPGLRPDSRPAQPWAAHLRRCATKVGVGVCFPFRLRSCMIISGLVVCWPRRCPVWPVPLLRH